MQAAPTAVALLDSWLDRLLKADDRAWLRTQCERVAQSGRHILYVVFSSAGRRVGHDVLGLGSDDLALAERARGGWDPARWTAAHAARTRLVLAYAGNASFADDVARLFAAADLDELVALYQALPVLPEQERWTARASEGVRSNMKPVFEAVALDNPYPAERLDEGAWNQLVLKALFVGSPLHRIRNLDGRANPRLTTMLCDYADERRAARRTVPPALWRPVARSADPRAVVALEAALGVADERERRGASLAIAQSPDPAVRALAARRTEAGRLAAGATWEQLA